MKIKKELQQNLKKETAKRVFRMTKEFKKQEDFKMTLFENKENYNQLVMMTNIKAAGKCEHHHLQFDCVIHVGYIPGEWVMGASKFNRIVRKYLNPGKATLQERATQQILNDLMKLKPLGAMIVVKGKHSCIQYRGVRDDSTMITSAVGGVFSTNDGARQEFLELIK